MREPVEITIEPDCIRIISYGEPDRSIRLDDLNRGAAHVRRYCNRKLGDFLKELDLTEGKAKSIRHSSEMSPKNQVFSPQGRARC